MPRIRAGYLKTHSGSHAMGNMWRQKTYMNVDKTFAGKQSKTVNREIWRKWIMFVLNSKTKKTKKTQTDLHFFPGGLCSCLLSIMKRDDQNIY